MLVSFLCGACQAMQIRPPDHACPEKSWADPVIVAANAGTETNSNRPRPINWVTRFSRFTLLTPWVVEDELQGAYSAFAIGLASVVNTRHYCPRGISLSMRPYEFLGSYPWSKKLWPNPVRPHKRS